MSATLPDQVPPGPKHEVDFHVFVVDELGVHLLARTRTLRVTLPAIPPRALKGWDRPARVEHLEGKKGAQQRGGDETQSQAASDEEKSKKKNA